MTDIPHSWNSRRAIEAATDQESFNIGALEIRPSEFMAPSTADASSWMGAGLKLLTALAERHDRIVSREELYRSICGEPYRKSAPRSTSTSASCATSWSRRARAGS